MLSKYKPRQGSRITPRNGAKGMYLEEPVLHYTIGTKVNRSVLNDLKEFGVEDVNVHQEPPKHTPFFQRALLALEGDEDWQTRLGGWYTSRSYEDSVARGSISDSNTTSFIPAVANPAELGEKLKTTGRY